MRFFSQVGMKHPTFQFTVLQPVSWSRISKASSFNARTSTWVVGSRGLPRQRFITSRMRRSQHAGISPLWPLACDRVRAVVYIFATDDASSSASSYHPAGLHHPDRGTRDLTSTRHRMLSYANGVTKATQDLVAIHK